MTTTCFACKSRLTVGADGKSGTCTNPRCIGGGRFHYCGYCRDIGFSLMPERMKCYNPACRMYDLTRSECRDCKKISTIEHNGRALCINRDCPGNAKLISECFFCFGKSQQKSFLSSPDVMFCTKGNCEYLLKRVEPCDVCRQQSFVVDDRVCMNPACEIAGVIVERCPTCNLRTQAQDARGGGRCLNPQCAPQEAPPAPEDATAQLPDYEPTLLVTPKPASPTPRAALDDVLATPPARPAAPVPTGRAPAIPRPGAITPRPQPAPPRVVRPSDPPAPPTPPPEPPTSPPAWNPPQQRRELPPPVAPPPVKPASPPMARPGPMRAPASAIEEAYEFLRTTLMDSGGNGTSPLHLIIGLPGSGKTVYLTMLGAVLGGRQQSFSFPYEGVEPNWVKVETLVARHRASADPKRLQRISDRIKDLVFGFGQDLHGHYIANRHWPPATPHDDSDDDPATYFLVSEILRNMRPVANVITLETSGEHYQEVLRNFPKYVQGAEPKNATQRVLIDLINNAEGFVLLLDPSNSDNDAIFKNFLMVVKDALRPRALNVFFNELRGSIDLPKGVIDPKKMDPRALWEAIERDKQRQQRIEQEIAKTAKMTGDRIAEIAKKLESGKHDFIATGEDGKWLESHSKILAELEPELMKGARERLLPAGAQFSSTELQQRLVLYYKGLCRVLTDRLDAITRKQLETARPGGEKSAILEIKKKYDLSDAFRVEPDPNAFEEREVTHLQRLKYISVVVTKSDKMPIIYPPEQYARRKLHGCDLHLRDISDYLRLCGGQVRFYNTSATGYTLLTGGSHMPGPANTHTPINILEPLFDMLNIQAG